MEPNRNRLLSRLRFELEFVKSGGYRRHPRQGWRAPYIFEESPSCPNFCDRTRPHECRNCWLMQFVTAHSRDEQIPCRFVQLEHGVTVDSLYRFGTPAETEETLISWLRRQINVLEINNVNSAHLLHAGTGTEHQGQFIALGSRRHSG